MKLTREFYIPKDSRAITDEETGAVAYVYETNGVPYGMAFTGKRSKPDWHYRFRSEGDRESRIQKHFARVRASKAFKAEQKAKRTKPHDLKVGDIFSCSWGYEQTNVDFYEVTKIVGAKTVEIREIASQMTNDESGAMSGYVLPCPGKFVGEPMRKRVDMSSSRPAIKMTSYSAAFFWSGEKKYMSWYY